MAQSVFRSPEGRDRLLECYNGILQTVPVARRYVDTPYGRTFLLEVGDPTASPVVLLHGSCGNSAFWLGDVPALAPRFRVLAVDIPGEPGNSEDNRLDPSTGAHAAWLASLLDALSIARASIVGNSLGGWVALHFAAAFPNRVHKLALIAASGIAPNNASFIAQSTEAVKKGAPAPVDVLLGDTTLPEPIAAFLRLIWDNFIPMTGALPVLSDEGLRRLNMPVIALVGEHDGTMDAGAMARRLGTLVPNAEVHVLEGQGHVLINTMGWIAPFLAGSDEEHLSNIV